MNVIYSVPGLDSQSGEGVGKNVFVTCSKTQVLILWCVCFMGNAVTYIFVCYFGKQNFEIHMDVLYMNIGLK